MTAAYFAGLLDGEGSIWIRHGRNHVGLTVEISNRDPRPLRLLYGAFGGWMGQFKGKYWSRRLSDKEGATAFLQWIQPHCIIKYERVRLALEFWAGMGTRHAPVRQTLQEDMRREYLAFQIKAYNEKGVEFDEQIPGATTPTPSTVPVILG